MRLLAAALIVTAASGCRPSDTFHCASDDQCKRGSAIGRCEPVGYCAFTDTDCESMHRYDPTARDDLAGECVPAADAGMITDDASDDWPCGPKPAAPDATVTRTVMQGAVPTTVTLMNSNLDTTRLLIAGAGAQITFKTSYSIVDCICPFCFDQIEVGLVPGPRLACIYDGNPQGSTDPCATPTTGNPMRTITAPTTPGQYELRFKLGQDFACDQHPSWWEDMPPMADTTVAYLCVL
jgi:hypothetical protein